MYHTISNVVHTFRSLGRPNSMKDDNKISIHLLRQFRSFRNEDPKEKSNKRPFHLQSLMS